MADMPDDKDRLPTPWNPGITAEVREREECKPQYSPWRSAAELVRQAVALIGGYHEEQAVWRLLDAAGNLVESLRYHGMGIDSPTPGGWRLVREFDRSKQAREIRGR